MALIKIVFSSNVSLCQTPLSSVPFRMCLKKNENYLSKLFFLTIFLVLMSPVKRCRIHIGLDLYSMHILSMTTTKITIHQLIYFLTFIIWCKSILQKISFIHVFSHSILRRCSHHSRYFWCNRASWSHSRQHRAMACRFILRHGCLGYTVPPIRIPSSLSEAPTLGLEIGRWTLVTGE